MCLSHSIAIPAFEWETTRWIADYFLQEVAHAWLFVFFPHYICCHFPLLSLLSIEVLKLFIWHSCLLALGFLLFSVDTVSFFSHKSYANTILTESIWWGCGSESIRYLCAFLYFFMLLLFDESKCFTTCNGIFLERKGLYHAMRTMKF
jgi:hypothetical protein